MSLLSHPDPAWPIQAASLIAEWIDRVEGLATIHHIGSTSVPGLPAKPIIDLLPVFVSFETMEAAQTAVEALGYEWMGEFGLTGRRYARRDTEDGRREVQAHCYVTRSPEITRHIAFRDALRQTPGLRVAYTTEKARCVALHPGDSAAYSACKSDWIKKAERRALERLT